MARFRVSIRVGPGTTMRSWLARLRYVMRRHGAVGFMSLAAYNVVYYINSRRHAERLPAAPDSFDESFGTDTAGIREIGSLGDVNTSGVALCAERYEPSSAQLVWAEIEKLKIDYNRYVFVDFGSGKGRVLFVAARFPFDQVLGIEFSRELHQIALRNVTRLPVHVAHRICCIHGDAASFELPKSNLVCYFYNPFGPPVIASVITRLAAHHRQHGYQVIVIYHDPRHRGIFENTHEFVVLRETRDTLVMITAFAN